MSGHSKWSTIKHKKGAADAKRGKNMYALGMLCYIYSLELALAVDQIVLAFGNPGDKPVAGAGGGIDFESHCFLGRFGG